MSSICTDVFMQDGCNRSGFGGCRGNVFVDSHHSAIRDRDIDLHPVGEVAVICINLSSAGSKRDRPVGVVASFITSLCVSAGQAAPWRLSVGKTVPSRACAGSTEPSRTCAGSTAPSRTCAGSTAPSGAGAGSEASVCAVAQRDRRPVHHHREASALLQHPEQQPRISRRRLHRSRDTNGHVRTPANPNLVGLSQNSESRRSAFQENSPHDCKKPNRTVSVDAVWMIVGRGGCIRTEPRRTAIPQTTMRWPVMRRTAMWKPAGLPL
jgi:hypothetical protein